MELTQQRNWKNAAFLTAAKSFLIWSFTLGVSWLVVGFPLVFILVTLGTLAVVVLHSVLPISAVLVVASSIIGSNLLIILAASAVLTFKGVHPHEVSWLSWLNGNASPKSTSVYATCPLTCELKN
ncbi:MAG: hypothetical protein AB4038_11235 [Prochloraceae cyanobacterium]